MFCQKASVFRSSWKRIPESMLASMASLFSSMREA